MPKQMTFMAACRDFFGLKPNHTPGKLHVDPKRALRIANDDDETVASTGTTDSLREANARRLVACWNALDGISTEALEQSKPMAQLVIDHAMLIDALETLTTLLRGDGRFPATAAQLEITLAKHGRSA